MRSLWFTILALELLCRIGAVRAQEESVLRPVVEVEEEVYSFQPADNGAGPMWCHGNTCVVRLADRVFASGLETIAEASPLNNCRPLLYARVESDWKLVFRDERRTREPCPLARGGADTVLLSVNPTLAPPDAYAGPARPEILEFRATSPGSDPVTHVPVWKDEPAFSEHSYRSFAVDGGRGEWIIFQNIGYGHAEWAFRDSEGDWSASGQLKWPWGSTYEKPQPVRICYPAIALKDRAVYFCGVSDIIEPRSAWRDYKKKLTGRDWDYDFRRLFFTSSDDITKGRFHDWVEVSSRGATCGWIFPMDLHVAATGDVFLLWSERAIDERLREEFFPDAKQRFSLECALVCKGRIRWRRAIVEGGEGVSGIRPGDGRFHVDDRGRLLVLYYRSGVDGDGRSLSENRLVEIHPDGRLGPSSLVELKTPLSAFFTATPRAGCRPSSLIDVLGQKGRTMRYARIRVR